jgi:hypothetical protein
MARKKREDWLEIEKEWAAGQLDRAEIARRYNVDRKNMRNHMRDEGIEYGSLAGSVRIKTQAKLVSDPDGDLIPQANTPGWGKSEAVEKAAERGADVVRLQRKDIAVLRDLEDKFLAELGGDPTKLYITQYQGQIVQAETGIAVTERIAALRNLTAARAQRITLERIAYGLDEKSSDEHNGIPGVIIHDPRITD